MPRLGAAIVVAFLAAQGGPAVSGDASHGATLFSGRCAICHSAVKGGPNKIGPNLFGVMGRRAGSLPGYTYSGAMQKSGIVWSPTSLNGYLRLPAQTVPGTKMAFAGIPDAGTRDDLIAYLGTLK